MKKLQDLCLIITEMNQKNTQYTHRHGDNAINISIRNSESFDYKTKIVGSLAAGELEKDDVEIAIPLKYLGNF